MKNKYKVNLHILEKNAVTPPDLSVGRMSKAYNYQCKHCFTHFDNSRNASR